jgi:hypothetical protein
MRGGYRANVHGHTGDTESPEPNEEAMVRKVRTVTSTTSETTKRQRRSPAQIVADLQAEIDRVKQRAAAQEARANPDARALVAAARFLDRTGDAVTGDAKRALDAARALLREQLVAMGLRLPQRRRRQQEAA